MNRETRIAVLILLLALGREAFASVDVLWLTETPPPKPNKSVVESEHSHSGHDHHAMAHSPVAASAAPETHQIKKHDHDTQISLDEAPGKDHRPGKQIWLRMGDDIKSARYLASEDDHLTLIGLQGKRGEIAGLNEGGVLTSRVELPEIGFYDAYLERRTVGDGRLQVQLPKIELLWATCSAKEVDEEAMAAPIVNAASPLELVREHRLNEGCMARLVSGDEVSFRVLSYGKPVAGVPVSMVTQEGWSSTRVSDADGRVIFILIREYFPKWLEFKKYHTDTFLMTAKMVREEAGVWQGARYNAIDYVATLPGKYRPSPYDYRSYAWGLGISLFVIVFGGVSVYLYRRRRVKPYKEERVDGKA